ncbi:MAG: peptidase C39, partial [Firmicutes bacterium]|nr:peptidase C39 [Bacillota bacterium]
EVYISRDSKIAVCLQQGGAVVSRVMLGGWHYVLLTGIDEEFVYLFDPYFRKNPFKEDGIEMINNAPTKWNRKVRFDIMNKSGKTNYALGEPEIRETMLIYNTDTRRTAENSIEYFI